MSPKARRFPPAPGQPRTGAGPAPGGTPRPPRPRAAPRPPSPAPAGRSPGCATRRSRSAGGKDSIDGAAPDCRRTPSQVNHPRQAGIGQSSSGCLPADWKRHPRVRRVGVVLDEEDIRLLHRGHEPFEEHVLIVDVVQRVGHQHAVQAVARPRIRGEVGDVRDDGDAMAGSGKRRARAPRSVSTAWMVLPSGSSAANATVNVTATTAEVGPDLGAALAERGVRDQGARVDGLSSPTKAYASRRAPVRRGRMPPHDPVAFDRRARDPARRGYALRAARPEPVFDDGEGRLELAQEEPVGVRGEDGRCGLRLQADAAGAELRPDPRPPRQRALPDLRGGQGRKEPVRDHRLREGDLEGRAGRRASTNRSPIATASTRR